jgi:hypothetical protein
MMKKTLLKLAVPAALVALVVLAGCSNPAGDGDALPNALTPPGEVTNFTATPGERSITFTWTNPADEDFECTRIMSDGFFNHGIPGGPGENCSYTMTHLSESTTYTITVKTEDTLGNLSNGIPGGSVQPLAP